MREPVKQRRGHLGVAKDAGPFGEVQIGGDHYAGMLIEFGEQVKQQRPARGTNRLLKNALTPSVIDG